MANMAIGPPSLGGHGDLLHSNNTFISKPV